MQAAPAFLCGGGFACRGLVYNLLPYSLSSNLGHLIIKRLADLYGMPVEVAKAGSSLSASCFARFRNTYHHGGHLAADGVSIAAEAKYRFEDS